MLVTIIFAGVQSAYGSGSRKSVIFRFIASVFALATSFTLVGNIALTHKRLVSLLVARGTS